ncbi:tRNA (adenosine(37)-N6)-threonylcarbamoyltransferase complex ATPase subunit type 1 TsaE [Tenacibaculum crassostreae]|uniref:tRNA (adenosine(37)-N6)-threonylcarbamoyltransferase complex ATPase subunit type 1 TsaE n=1 Tax=Tenacibaculum crassostreae TaxID=502683 RepID=UPI0038953E3F
MNKNYSLSELRTIAEEVLATASHKILLFYGEMGIGKTTLIKELCNVLGVEDVASSPTFSLVNEYKTNTNETVYHFDFYRINDEEEAYDMGVEDYFYSNNWCLVEWPENVKNLLPLDTVSVSISLLENGQRNIQLKTN